MKEKKREKKSQKENDQIDIMSQSFITDTSC